jgi:hypothetical protein
MGEQARELARELAGEQARELAGERANRQKTDKGKGGPRSGRLAENIIWVQTVLG